jgi:D-glycero-D-manno-heptose 1,7-bisphosphate phosphatase
LDRDGVINANRREHVRKWSEFRFLPNVFAPIRQLANHFSAIVVVTNQSAIARGLLSHQSVAEIHERMRLEIARYGGRIDGIYYCPHGPSDECSCRKPRPGLLLQAAQDLELDLGRSFLIGDKVSDVDAAIAVSCSPIFVLTGEGVDQRHYLSQPRYARVPVLPDLDAASHYILGSTGNLEAQGD